MPAKKTPKSSYQPYPRTTADYLDDSQLEQHPEPRAITVEALKNLIAQAIKDAEQKSSRFGPQIEANLTPDQEEQFYLTEGRELFEYFHKYPSDPAATAHEYHHKNYRKVGTDLFRSRTLQKSRMNSGWRYQFLAQECATHSKRFRYVSGIASAEGDFSAVIQLAKSSDKPVHLYVSVKNRRSTLGGQDWPKAIIALEEAAKADKNRTGPYCCVFGIAMTRGERSIPRKQGSTVRSYNTEIWMADFFWPFFSAYTYQQIMT